MLSHSGPCGLVTVRPRLPSGCGPRLHGGGALDVLEGVRLAEVAVVLLVQTLRLWVP